MGNGNDDLGTPLGILEAALAKEKEAYVFYDGLLGRVKVDFIKTLVAKLRDEEGKHRRMIEKELVRLRLGRD